MKCVENILSIDEMFTIFESAIRHQMDSNTTTTPQITNISQLDKANEVLKGLAINVTVGDKDAAHKKMKVSIRWTIDPCLRGEAKDLDLAMRMIEFFQKRIEDRDRKLEGAA